jgi:hypothetical protein
MQNPIAPAIDDPLLAEEPQLDLYEQVALEEFEENAWDKSVKAEENLVMAWGDLEIDEPNQTLALSGTKSTINDFVKAVQNSESKNILDKNYDEISNSEIPSYYMQVRYGSTFSKVKHVRVYAYFADAILFPDGALWRDA